MTHPELAQLQGSIESLNKAGEQYKIAEIDYQPTLAEISAENTKLRQQIYHAVLEQQEKINTHVYTGKISASIIKSGYSLCGWRASQYHDVRNRKWRQTSARR
ncbi:MAG: hypothetical protein LRY43_00745 [Gammaproteobacteria bacterium]|nr:hypothetical protein [Gammaproteobacteria bacterium]